MRDRIFWPSRLLQPYIKNYWTCCHPTDTRELMYPSGCVELCINISANDTIRNRDGGSIRAPILEILGHWTAPTTAIISKGNSCLITRFQPYASSFFFTNPASDFTNRSTDLCDVFGNDSVDFYDRLINCPTLEQKIETLEDFLLLQLIRNQKKHAKLELAAGLCNDIYKTDNTLQLKNLAARHGVSERYIQHFFNNLIGLTPQKFLSVQRFTKSLELIKSSAQPLTSIAFECGYYDQAHFIREFKSYTGLTPRQAKGLSSVP